MVFRLKGKTGFIRLFVICSPTAWAHSDNTLGAWYKATRWPAALRGLSEDEAFLFLFCCGGSSCQSWHLVGAALLLLWSKGMVLGSQCGFPGGASVTLIKP